jgi:hypothetical protein
MSVLLRSGMRAGGPGPRRAMRPRNVRSRAVRPRNVRSRAVRSRAVRWLAGRWFGFRRLGFRWLGFRRLAGQWSILGRRVGQAEPRQLDRGHDGGQGRAEVRDFLPFFLLLLGSDGCRGQPFAHRAQSAGLRPCLDDAIRRVKDRHRTDNDNNEQVNHEFPSLAEEVLRSFEPMRGRDQRRWWRARGWLARSSAEPPTRC